MATTKRPIFRESAWRHYTEQNERMALPHFVTPPRFALLWILLGLLFILGSVAWWSEIPVYTSGPAILRDSGAVPALHLNGQKGVIAIVFLPTTPLSTLHPGLPVFLQIGKAGPPVTGRVIQVMSSPVSPQEARQRYGLDSSEGVLITQPSQVMIVSLPSSVSPHTYTGSIVTAQVQTGSERLLSLLLGMRS